MRKTLIALAAVGMLAASAPARADDGLDAISFWDALYQSIFGPSPDAPTTGGMQGDNLGDGVGL